MPLISVIIPTFENSSQLMLTLESVYRQSSCDFEVVVVNDGGSTDLSGLCSMFEGLSIINLPTNLGPAAARNTGLAATTGEIVHFLDSDDLLETSLYSVVQRHFQDVGFDVLVFAHQDFAHPDDLRFESANSAKLTFSELDPVSFYHFAIDNTGFFIPSSSFFRRSTLVSLLGSNPWRESLRNAEDTLLFLMLGQFLTFKVCFAELVGYRRSESGLSSNRLSVLSGSLRCSEILIDWTILSENQNKEYFLRYLRRLRSRTRRSIAKFYFSQGCRSKALKILASAAFDKPEMKDIGLFLIILLKSCLIFFQFYLVR